jgi:hypothetical protein
MKWHAIYNPTSPNHHACLFFLAVAFGVLDIT